MLQVIKALNNCNFPEIKHDVDVDYLGADGRKYKYSYASLQNIIKSATPELTKNGLRLVQLTCSSGLRTILCHTSGEYIDDVSAPGVEFKNIQDWGASITYQRRYAIVCLLGLVTEDDRDGRITVDYGTDVIGGKPKLDDSTYYKMVDAIRSGDHKSVELSMNKYSLTFNQKEELNILINRSKASSLKKSTK
jgi:hypothetical protein